jgi:hypothetical protein
MQPIMKIRCPKHREFSKNYNESRCVRFADLFAARDRSKTLVFGRVRKRPCFPLPQTPFKIHVVVEGLWHSLFTISTTPGGFSALPEAR